MNGLCPACRRPYDEKTIEFKTVSPEEFKADMALKARKQVAAKQKEAEKRQNETLSRKNLAGLRVVQKNLVYVVGLNLTPRQKEDDLLKILRGPEFFGQYGKIIKIVVSKAKEGATANSIGVYVTFARKEDAESCISAVDGTTNVDRVLRAQYGTTKYCSAFLRNEQCNNRSCMFLHETGEDSDSFSRQDLSSLNATQRPSQPGPSQPAQSQPQGPPQQAPQPVAAASQPMHRQGSKDETGSRSGSADASALPSSASWANKDSHVNLNRRTSLAASRSSPSPRTGNASIASQKSEEPKREEPSSRAREKQPAQPPSPPSESVPSQTSSRKSSIEEINDTAITLLNRLIKDITSPNFKFIFSSSVLTADELRAIENHPCLIDVYGGMKRRLKREKEESTRAKEEEERAKQEAEAQNIQQATAMVEDENMEGGSLQLGGEPEETHDARRPTGRMSEPQSAISPPSQQGLVGSPLSLNQNFSSLSINGRSLTPQQLMLLKANNAQSGAGLMDQLQSFGGNAFDHGESNRGLFQHQMPQVSAQGHARHSSRFSFAGDSSNKNANTRILGHQSSMMQSNPLSAANTQNPLANHPYSSGIQHPPPGLKTAGTPPISGGGMFGQGHGFTSASNPLGMGSNFNNKDSDADLMREFQHGRGNVGGHGIGQSHETSKREYNFPSSYGFPSPSSTQAPALGLLGSFHDAQHGSYHELGQLKQKKKGKKHRHANTSSFGGGVVDHADPSILRARNHQGGAGAGQGLYGGQGQGLFPQSHSMYGGGFGRGW